MALRPCLLTLLCVVLHGTCARAQIVNIEDQRKGFDTLGWYGQLDLGGNLTRNRSTVVTLNGGLRVDRVAPAHRLLLLGDYRLVRVSGANALNAGFGHLRYAYYLGDRWRWEVFTQLQYDERLRLGVRFLIGSGPRLRLLARKQSRAYLGLLYMYEYDEVAEGTLTYRDHRMSAYLSCSLRPGRRISLTNTTYYQPVLTDFRSARLSTVQTVELGLTDRLSFRTRFNLVYDPLLSRDLDDVPTTNYQWTNGLRLKF